MSNAYSNFKALVGTSATDVVTITNLNGDGTSTSTTLAGNTVIVKGESVSVGNKAYIRGGEVIGQAPNHSVTQVSI